ncbi:MAG: hypothetical protein ABJQ90_18775 [Parasphingorhabdus sp.]
MMEVRSRGGIHVIQPTELECLLQSGLDGGAMGKPVLPLTCIVLKPKAFLGAASMGIAGARRTRAEWVGHRVMSRMV